MNDHDLLIRIDEGVKAIREHAEKHQQEDDEVHQDHDERLRTLEASGQSQRGAVSAIIAAVSALWAIGSTIFMALHK